MQEFNVDFHIHSKYSKGVSDDMMIPKIAEQAELKGLDLVGTGDGTHPQWIKHLERYLVDDDGGVYSTEDYKTKFILTAEVEDANRVHHLILAPSMDCMKQFKEEIKGSSKDIDKDGRPHVSLTGEELVDLTNDCDSLMGPCHAFTPWTAVYKEFNSLRECYGENVRYVKFLELGLSADTGMADQISELWNLTFMTNSDAHSPWPHRLGREFNRIACKNLTFKEIKKSINREDDRGFVLNVGLNPKEGKYHETACTRCYLKFRVDDANRLGRRCPECGGLIKKGVRERIAELSDTELERHPVHRPPYMHIVPLAEVIAMAKGTSSVFGAKVQAEWRRMIDSLGAEIEILIDLDIDEIKKYDESIADIINSFRNERIEYDAGGGGRYGIPLLRKPARENFYDGSQKTLAQF
ncbi:MAG: TIGR00375 family protein [Candidatus Altiarchaeota archaeon]|nr:TIGR00375 family protein [Candidatus Altiarchaeota archaeon]